MRLLRLEMTNFGKFKNKIIDLDKNLVLIEGFNESGKSTTVKFIEGVFFGFVKPYLKTTRYTDDLKKFRPWNSTNYEGSIVFEECGEVFRVYRNFNTGEYIIYNEITGKDITSEFQGYRPSNKSFLGEYFFKVSSEVFNNTKIVGQNNVGIDDKSSIFITDKLLKTNYDDANSNSSYKSIEYLKSLKRDMGSKTNPNKPLGSVYKEHESICKEIDSIRTIKAKYDDTIEEISDLENELKHKNELITLKNRQIEYSKQENLIKIEEEKNKLLIEIEKLKIRQKILQENRLKYESEFIELNKLKEEEKYIKRAFDELSVIKREKYKNQNRINSEFNSLNDKLKETEGNKKKYFFTIISLIFLTIAISFFLIRYIQIGYLPVLILALIIDIILILKIDKPQGVFLIKSIENLKTEKKDNEEELEKIDNEIEYLLNDEELKEREIADFEKSLNLKYGVTIEDINLKDSEFEDNKNKIEELKARLNFILKSYSTDGIDSLEKVEFSKQFFLVENLDLNEIQREKEEKAVKNSRLKGQVSIWDKEVKKLPKLLEKRDYLKQKIWDMEEDVHVLDLTIKLIEESFEESKMNFIPALNKQINLVLRPIFNSSMEFYIDENLNISFKKDSESNLKSILSLSKGSQDIIYLVLKMAMSNQLYGKEDFIILDDALNYLDDIRLEEFLIHLSKIEDCQIIILTCQERESQILTNLKKVPIIKL